MKNLDLIFLRHGKLDLPYKDHREMPFDVICKLATGILNPSVDKMYTENLINRLFAENLIGHIDVIYSSPSNRCLNTANLVSGYLKKNQGVKNDINIIEEASEVYFDLRKIFDKSKNLGLDIATINKGVFLAMINGQGCEHIDNIQKRVKNLFSILLSDKRKKIIITHDFFMRVIELYIKSRRSLSDIKYKDLLNTTRNGYVCGFSTDFQMTDVFYLNNEPGE